MKYFLVGDAVRAEQDGVPYGYFTRSKGLVYFENEDGRYSTVSASTLEQLCDFLKRKCKTQKSLAYYLSTFAFEDVKQVKVKKVDKMEEIPNQEEVKPSFKRIVKWFKTSECKPEPFKTVVVPFGTDDSFIGWYTGEEWRQKILRGTDGKSYYLSEPEYWAYLPKLEKPESNDEEETSDIVRVNCRKCENYEGDIVGCCKFGRNLYPSSCDKHSVYTPLEEDTNIENYKVEEGESFRQIPSFESGSSRCSFCRKFFPNDMLTHYATKVKNATLCFCDSCNIEFLKSL